MSNGDRMAVTPGRQYGAGGRSRRAVPRLFCLLALILLPLSARAAVPNAPSGLTATSLSYTQAKLTWTDNSTDETYFYIEYKKGAAGTYSTLAGVTANTTTYTHTNATADTTYYYRVRAYNASGYSSYSSEASATTPAVNAPSNLAAVARSSSQVHLTWTDNSGDETGFSIERKAGAGGTYTTIANVSANVTGYTNTGLAQSTEYFYRVRAVCGSSYSRYSNEANATTLTLNAPSGLTVDTVSYAQIKLTWTDNSSDETYFSIERKSGSASYAQIGTASANATTYTNSGLAQGTEYFYRVRAVSGQNNSAYTNEVSATTPVFAAPSNLTATVLSSSQVQLTWMDNSSDESQFYIEYKEASSTGGYSGAWAGANATSSTVSNLKQQTSYLFRVKAYTGGIYSQPSNEVNATTLTLNAPSGLTVDTVSYAQIKLTWTDNSSDETYFSIERKSGSASYAQIGTASANATSYSSTGLAQGTEYFYRVRAVSGQNNSAYTNEVSATTPVFAAPSNLAAEPSSSTQIKLTWTDNSGDETYFYLEYKSPTMTNYATLTTLAANTTMYTHTNLKWESIYSYRVRAYHSSGSYSQYSNEASAATPAFIAPSGLTAEPLSPTQIKLTWTDNSGDELYFYIEYKSPAMANYATLTTLAANATTYTHTNLTPNTTYFYRVRAYNSGGYSAYSNETSGTTLTFAAPSNLTAIALSSTQIKISWSDNTSDETGFEIERKIGQYGLFYYLTSVGPATTTYTNTGLTPNYEYYYRVRAVKDSLSSPWSNEASAIAQDAAPGGLEAAALSSKRVRLTWTDMANDETQYFVEFRTGAGPYALLAELPGDSASYNHTELSADTTYSYRIRTFNGFSYSPYSNEAVVITPSCVAEGEYKP